MPLRRVSCGTDRRRSSVQRRSYAWNVAFGPGSATRVRRPIASARSLGFVEAPGVEPDGWKTRDIKRCAGLHKDRADLGVSKMGRFGSLESG